jgi:hypothetical protein
MQLLLTGHASGVTAAARPPCHQAPPKPSTSSMGVLPHSAGIELDLTSADGTLLLCLCRAVARVQLAAAAVQRCDSCCGGGSVLPPVKIEGSHACGKP